jgi:hypothetical protein
MSTMGAVGELTTVAEVEEDEGPDRIVASPSFPRSGWRVYEAGRLGIQENASPSRLEVVKAGSPLCAARLRQCARPSPMGQRGDEGR